MPLCALLGEGGATAVPAVGLAVRRPVAR